MLNAPAFSESQSMSETGLATFKPKSDFVRVLQERGYIHQLTDASGRLLAHATTTCLVFPL